MIRATALRAGDVAALPVPGGGYGACQVSSVDAKLVTVYLLKWWSENPPEQAQLMTAEPMLIDHHSHDGVLEHINVNIQTPIPAGFRWLGNQPVHPAVPASSNVYTGWASLGIQAASQRRWDLELPAPAKAAFKAAATRGQVELDFGAGPVRVGGAYQQLDLAGGHPVAVPPTEPVRWDALDVLPRCTSLIWQGPDRGLCEALAQRPMVSSLLWRDPPPEVDLSMSGLTSVTVHGDSLRGLRLPPHVHWLELTSTGAVNVTAAEGGRWINLVISASQGQPTIPTGLHEIRDVWLEGDGFLSGAALAGMTELEVLRLKWRKPPGLLADAQELNALQRLHHIHFIDGYQLKASTLPELPSLSYVEVDGMPRSADPQDTGGKSQQGRHTVRDDRHPASRAGVGSV